MEFCPICKGELQSHVETNENVLIRGWKCKNCNEIFFSSSEMLKWEVLTGRRKTFVRKIRGIGKSFVLTLPEKIVREIGIHKQDLALFEKTKDGLLVKIIHSE